MTTQTKLWARRHSIAYGWRWTLERTCDTTTAAEWLDIFRKQEPEVVFKLAITRPRATPLDKGDTQ